MGPRYYGQSEMRFGPQLTPAVKWLIIANAAVFFLQQLFFAGLGRDYLSIFFGLNPYAVLHGMVWQPATYMFLHYDLWHLLFNMFALWMFGSSVESVWGPREFLKYYFFTGIAAGLLSFLTSLGVNVITIGASGAIFGILVAFGMLFPNNIVLAFFLFPMRAKNFVLLFAALELYITVQAGPHSGGVARFAHLGGMLFGYLYLKFGDKVKYSVPRFSLPRIRFNMRPKKATNVEEWNLFMQNEVDPILDKISREGFGSLTRKERRILKKARGRSKQ